MNIMTNQWLALLISFLFIFAVIGAATLLMKRFHLKQSVSRKIIHIGVSHWWLVALVGIDDLAVALIGPLLFIILNTVSYRLRLIEAMENEPDAANLGTVYFPVSLTVLVTLCWSGTIPYAAGTVAILILGWGDGLAALVGENFGRLRFRVPGGIKSLEGTLTMGAVSALVPAGVFLFSGITPAAGLIPSVLAISCAATLIETLTPRGLDNLSIPVLTALLAAVLI
jgi:phytol kinase